MRNAGSVSGISLFLQNLSPTTIHKLPGSVALAHLILTQSCSLYCNFPSRLRNGRQPDLNPRVIQPGSRPASPRPRRGSPPGPWRFATKYRRWRKTTEASHPRQWSWRWKCRPTNSQYRSDQQPRYSAFESHDHSNEETGRSGHRRCG